MNGTADAGGAAAISWTTANTLTLSAYNNITIDAGATIHSTNAGSSLNLIANNSAATDVGSGSGVVTNNGTLTVAGPVNVYYNPTVYTAPVTYTNTGGAVTAYMLINNLTDLQNMNTNLTGTYALNTNIDATATISWNSGAGFAPLGAGSAATSFRGSKGWTSEGRMWVGMPRLSAISVR